MVTAEVQTGLTIQMHSSTDIQDIPKLRKALLMMRGSMFAGGSDAAKAQYAGIETKYVFTEDGYDVEFKIPFKDAKEIDSVVGFDIIVQDCDSEGRNAEIYMFPTDKTKSYWNLADVFGELTLKDAAPVGPEVDELITKEFLMTEQQVGVQTIVMTLYLLRL